MKFEWFDPSPIEPFNLGGIILSDPCVSSRWLVCEFATGHREALQMTVDLTNRILADDRVHFMHMLGDNFYDLDGTETTRVWSALSLSAQAKVLGVVPGNHDYWICGAPNCADEDDQFFIGGMQWYAQDTVSSDEGVGSPFVLSEPGKAQSRTPWNHVNNDVTNTFWYYMMGSVGFIGFSGAHTFRESLPYFSRACDYFQAKKPVAIFLLSHWNEDDGTSGVQTMMAAPDVRAALLHVPGCDIGFRLLYIAGHRHCNFPDREGHGFVIGGHGGSGCGEFGFLYLDAEPNDQPAIWYLRTVSCHRNQAGEEPSCIDHHNALLACVQDKGINGCTAEFGTRWL